MNLYETLQHLSLTQPSTLAFSCPEGTLTYRDLETHSNALSVYLSTRFPHNNNPIVVYGHMEPEMIVSFLGAVKAGHPYIPVDASFPLDRVQHIITSSNACLLIDLTNLSSTLEVNIPRLSDLAEWEHILTTHQGQSLSSDYFVKEEDTFYIIYTSGSTGNPKGVQIPYSSLKSFTKWAINDFSLVPFQHYLNQAPFSFDLSVMDLYPCLLTGGTLHALPKELMIQPKKMFEYIQSSSLQIWTSTPSFVEYCLAEPKFSSEHFPTLHTFLFCGEVLSVSTAQLLTSRFPSARIFNTYGPTEATVAITAIEVTKDVLSTYDVLPIGQCKSDCEIRIVKEDGTLALENEKGELVILGPSVGKGYLNEDEKNKHSFPLLDGKKAYKTGDAGYLHNGMLFYGGRMDLQVKVNGYRMEIEEIEHHLRDVSYVQSAIVIPIYKEGKCDYLTALFVASSHSFEKDYQLVSAIKKELAKQIPSYMIPRTFVRKDSLPMTQNGKIDRKRLIQEVVK